MDWNDWVSLYKVGYFDEKGHLRPEFVRRETVNDLAFKIANDGKGLTRTQVRRFFQHCRRMEQKLKVSKASWDDLRSDLFRLDNAAADAINKDKPKIPRLFHDFIMHNVKAVHTQHDFLDGFLRHFEALIGFGYGYFKKDQGAG
jgi:CRISPR type III-A-associated protein Csm2